MKPPWSLVKLRVSSWDGDMPVAGDELVTRTGRRYQILEVKPKALICFVLPRDAPIEGHVFWWYWDRRDATR
ncbi:hypothetical protein LMG22037_06338 [Paraburkholderia phenoliruptrix]|jgi:hypothetical protein|uniref:Uncharacterized protein n=1 Tax=Paraburkholderia phenoliruptrix TaxID=252970 RepID=A0A6J5CNI3_9BURK|nr:hypothetical protein [Paraburkholderia phenoliruptrix]CAB3739892.1 hypothetical protein LMG22037_06338 [Paraburkholderia phenoliruptrix]